MDGVQTLPELLVGGVRLEDVVFLGLELFDLGGVVVDAENPVRSVGVQAPVGGAADASHAEDDGLDPGEVEGPLLGVERVVRTVGDEVGDPGDEGGGTPVDDGGQHEGQGQGERHGGRLAAAQDAVLDGDGNDDDEMESSHIAKPKKVRLITNIAAARMSPRSEARAKTILIPKAKGMGITTKYKKE